MKVLSISLLFFLLSIILYAQEVKIPFRPKVPGEHIDSILVTNQSTLEKVKLQGSDTLVLTKATSLLVIQSFIREGQLYPNPCQGDAYLSFSTFKVQKVEVRVYSITGELVGQNRMSLPFGNHRFRIRFPGTGLYSVTVLSPEGSLSYKAVSLAVGSQSCLIDYSGSEDRMQLKNVATNKTLGFSDGDILLYAVFSGRNQTIMTDSPEISKVYGVEFYGCIDADDNSYPVVKIGDQIWMAENLKTTKYNDGDVLNYKYTADRWETISMGYGWFDYNISYKATFGALYDWYAVNNGKLCPTGWHVPSKDEWTTLEIYLQNNGYNYDGSIDTDNNPGTNNKAAKSLASTEYWRQTTNPGSVGNADYPNYRNKTGFSAVPAGVWEDKYAGMWIECSWWTSTEFLSNAWHLALRNSSDFIWREAYSKSSGYSVRCVRN